MAICADPDLPPPVNPDEFTEMDYNARESVEHGVFSAEWEEKMSFFTDDQLEVLESYTNNGYRLINGNLRDRPFANLDADDLAQIVEMDDITNFEIGQDMVLWRGVDENLIDEMELGREGLVWQDKGFSSTSIYRDTASDFIDYEDYDLDEGGPWLMKIFASKKTKGAYVASHGQKGEYEMLLRRGTRFRVRSVDFGRRRIDMEVIP